MRLAAVTTPLAIVLWLAALLSPLFVVRAPTVPATLQLSMATKVTGAVQVYFDTGSGYTEARSERQSLKTTDGTPAEYTFSLPASKLRALRIDPLTNPGVARLESIRIVGPDGGALRQLTAAALHPLSEVASLQETSPGNWTLATTDGSLDSSLEWQLDPPLDLRRNRVLWLVRGAWLTAALVGLVLLWRSARIVRWRTPAVAWIDRHPWVVGGPMAVVGWLALFDTPFAPGTDLDPSWQQVMALAASKHWAWGRDIIFTGGPLSFLNQPFAIAETLFTKLAWDGFGKLVLSGLTVAALWSLPWARRLSIWLLLTFYGWFFSDAVYQFMLTLLIATWLLPHGTGWKKSTLAMLTLLLFSHIKFTYLLVSMAGVGLASLAAAGRREGWRAILLPVTAATGFAISWVTLGQPLAGLPDYLRTSWEISAGYPWAMVSVETLPVLLCGVAVVGWIGIGLGQAAWTATDRAGVWSQVALAALTVFLAWKHGFTRADGHVLGLFWFGALMACALPVWLGKRTHRWRFELAVPLALTGAWFVEPQLMTHAPDYTIGRIQGAVRTLEHPKQFVQRWRQQEAAAKKEALLPRMQAEVGSHPVDVFNYEQGRAILNGMNYRPRPVFQSYSAYTPELQERNLRFVRSPRAPEYFLWRTDSIDNRYAPEDDAPLWVELPERYTLCFSEQEFALLARKPQPTAHGTKTLCHQQNVRLGQLVEIPEQGSDRLWLEITAVPSLLGKLRAALYRPALLDFLITDNSGREVRHRLLPKTAETGFLVRPLIESQADFLAYMQGQVGEPLRSVRIEAASHESKYWSGIQVRVYRLVSAPTTQP